jgi:hypothetical protein
VDARLYADDGRRRLRQVAGDLLVLVVTGWTVRTAGRLADGVREFGAVADGLDRSGRTVSDAASRAGSAVEPLPAVGGALSAPFRALGGAGQELATAGAQVERSVDQLAFWLPALLLVVVLGWVATRYVPSRLHWIREATEVTHLLADADAAQLLGTRAAATRPLRTLRRHVDDPAAALADGRYEELATIELRALGLSPDRLAGRVPT